MKKELLGNVLKGQILSSTLPLSCILIHHLILLSEETLYFKLNNEIIPLEDCLLPIVNLGKLENKAMKHRNGLSSGTLMLPQLTLAYLRPPKERKKRASCSFDYNGNLLFHSDIEFIGAIWHGVARFLQKISHSLCY